MSDIYTNNAVFADTDCEYNIKQSLVNIIYNNILTIQNKAE